MAKEAPCFLDMGCGYEEYPMRTIGYSTTVFTLQMLALEIGRRKALSAMRTTLRTAKRQSACRSF